MFDLSGLGPADLLPTIAVELVQGLG